MLLSLLACTAGERTDDTGAPENWSQLEWANCRADVAWTDAVGGDQAEGWYVYDERGRLVDTFDGRVGSYGQWQTWTYDGELLVDHAIGDADYYDVPTERAVYTHDAGLLVSVEWLIDELYYQSAAFAYDADDHLEMEVWEERGGPAWVNHVATDEAGRTTRVDRYDEPDDGELDEWHLTTWSEASGNVTWETESFSKHFETIWKAESETVNHRGDRLSWWSETFTEGFEDRREEATDYDQDLRPIARTAVWYSGPDAIKARQWDWEWEWTDDGLVVGEVYRVAAGEDPAQQDWSGIWIWTCS